LRSKLSSEMADTLEKMCVSSAWHAANVRSFFWSAAESELQKFNEASAHLPPLMRTAQIAEHRAQRDREDARFARAEQPLRSGTASKQHCCSSACSAVPKLFFDRRAARLEAMDATPPCSPLSSPLSSPRGSPRSPRSPTAIVFEAGETPPKDPHTELARKPTVFSPRETPGLCRHMNVLAEAVLAWQGVTCGSQGVPAAAFLHAATATAAIFDCLGSMVASVKADVSGNVDKIRKNIRDDLPLTLEQMVEGELKNNVSPTQEGSTALAVLWLGRMLRLLDRMVSQMCSSPSSSLSECVLAGYDSCLSPHHPWAMRKATSMAIRGCPSRQVFFEKLGDNPADAHKWLAPFHEAAGPALTQVKRFMVNKGFEQPDAFEASL